MQSAPELSFHRVRLATGLTMHFARQGPAAGKPLLLLHGFADSWQSFALTLAALPPHITVYAPDLRGHGDTDRPGAGYSLDQHAQDVIALLDSQNIGCVTLAGHSMGSFIAQNLAAKHPDRVDKLVLMASAPTGATDIIKAFLAEVLTLTDPIDPQYVADFQHPSLPVPQEFLDEVIARSLRIPAAVWKAALTGLVQADNRALLPSIRAATALAWGTRDGLFDRAQQDQLLAAIPGSTLWEYDAGHALHWERPAVFAADLARFHDRGAR